MSILNFLSDIKDFHEKYGLEYNGPIRALPQDIADFRMRCLIEEAEEGYGANQELVENDTVENRAELLDAMVDALYFLTGTMYTHGFNFRQIDVAWHRVHAANMRKVRAQPDGSDSLRNHGSDVVKPEGWVPASLTDLV